MKALEVNRENPIELKSPLVEQFIRTSLAFPNRISLDIFFFKLKAESNESKESVADLINNIILDLGQHWFKFSSLNSIN